MQFPSLMTDYKIKINLDERSQHNLDVLWNRKGGERLYSDESGMLTKMSFCQRLFYRISKSYRDDVNQQLSKTISNLTLDISKKTIDGDQSEAFISDLFFHKLSRLSRHVYKRDLTEYVVNILTDKLKLEDEKIPKDASASYATAYKSAKLWARLGNFEALTGCSGSYRIIQGKILKNDGLEEADATLGIFKPAEEDTLAEGNRKMAQRIKRFLIGTVGIPFKGSLFDTVAGQAYVAEAATKIVERHVLQAVKGYLKTHEVSKELQGLLDKLVLVPDTQVGKIGLGNKAERSGSFQMWVQEAHQEASHFFGVKENYQKGFLKSNPSLEELKAKMPTELFDLLVIIDYLTANSDRHGGNWFVIPDKEGVAKEIRLIDGGWSMAPKHPTAWSKPELGKQYLWQHLALAEEGFSDLARFVIEDLLKNQDALQADMDNLYNQHFPKEADKNKNRVDRMLERLEVMNLKQDSTKQALAKIRTETEIKQALDHGYSLDTGDVMLRNPWTAQSYASTWDKITSIARVIFYRLFIFKTYYNHVGIAINNNDKVSITETFKGKVRRFKATQKRYGEWTAVKAVWEKIYQDRSKIALDEKLKAEDLSLKEFKSIVQGKIRKYLVAASKENCPSDWAKIMKIPFTRKEMNVDGSIELPNQCDSFSCTGLVDRAWLYAGIDIFKGQKTDRTNDKDATSSLNPDGIYPEDFIYNQYFKQMV